MLAFLFIVVVFAYLGREESILELPSGIRESLQLKSEHSETVVAKLLQHLKLDDSSFKDPLAEHKTEAKKWIRCLMREAKCLNRTDVAEYLRKTMPAGTTGGDDFLFPLLSPIKYTVPFEVLKLICGEKP